MLKQKTPVSCLDRIHPAEIKAEDKISSRKDIQTNMNYYLKIRRTSKNCIVKCCCTVRSKPSKKKTSSSSQIAPGISASNKQNMLFNTEIWKRVEIKKCPPKLNTT